MNDVAHEVLDHVIEREKLLRKVEEMQAVHIAPLKERVKQLDRLISSKLFDAASGQRVMELE